jgi:curli biogenesis system outer membrane secretion channel CsgG
MKRIHFRRFVLALALGSAGYGTRVSAQAALAPEAMIHTTAVAPPPEAPPVVVPTPGPRAPAAANADKPAIVVMGFESGTVSAQVGDKRRFMSFLGAMHGSDYNGEQYDPSQLGIGIADMLIEKLLATGQFRLVERKANETSSGAQYIVTGSVTRFGFEERNVGGIFASVATMGLLSYKQHKTEVALTARIINAATGEIVASMRSDGTSGKGGGLRVFGLGSNGMGGGDVSSSNFRSTAIGQATERAVADLAAKIVEKKISF